MSAAAGMSRAQTASKSPAPSCDDRCKTERMRAIGVHHVSINVSDVSEALVFYVDVLGLAARGDRPDFSFGGAWLDVGAQQMHLIEGEPPGDVGQHVALRVEDIDAVVKELEDRGIAVTTPVGVGTGRQSFLHDPSGNRIELNQPGAG